MVEEVVSSSKRFRFDPWAVADRRTKLLSELNIDDLREASNNSAGILCYLPSKPDPEHEEPDVSDSFVAKEITVTQEETTELIIPVLPPTLTEQAENFTDTEEYYIEVCRPLVCSNVDSVSDATKEQSASGSWLNYRRGRITASKLLKVAKKVREDGSISEKNESLLKDITCYRPPAYSPAIHWGQYNEDKAIEAFFKCRRSKHKKLKIQRCGVILCDKNPIIAASPDAIVSCSCCGDRPLEVKNPFTHRNLSIPDYTKQPDSCLYFTTTGEINLKRNHDYYYQVQTQILAKHSEVGYFCVKTACLHDSLHVEEIPFDPLLMEDAVEKAKIFFKSIVVPELMHGELKKKLESIDLSNEVTSSDLEETEATLTSSVVNYMCHVCHKECIDKPVNINDMSVYCDLCKDWFHWVCVGLKGTETVSKRCQLKWKCPFCTE